MVAERQCVSNAERHSRRCEPSDMAKQSGGTSSHRRGWVSNSSKEWTLAHLVFSNSPCRPHRNRDGDIPGRRLQTKGGVHCWRQWASAALNNGRLRSTPAAGSTVLDVNASNPFCIQSGKGNAGGGASEWSQREKGTGAGSRRPCPSGQWVWPVRRMMVRQRIGSGAGQVWAVAEGSRPVHQRFHGLDFGGSTALLRSNWDRRPAKLRPGDTCHAASIATVWFRAISTSSIATVIS